jgi:hypothetical protein
MVNSSKFFLFIAILLALIPSYRSTSAFQQQEISSMKMFRIKEPLQISGEDDGEYILPVGTVLYYEDSFAEGHSLFWTPFYHKGKIDWEEVHLEQKHQGRLIVPLWLNNINAEQLKALFARLPLTKSDINAAIKANQITKDDLVDIIRSMPE